MFILIVSFCATVNGGPLQCKSFVQERSSPTLAECKVRRDLNIYALGDILKAKGATLEWAKVTCEDVGVDG